MMIAYLTYVKVFTIMTNQSTCSESDIASNAIVTLSMPYTSFLCNNQVRSACSYREYLQADTFGADIKQSCDLVGGEANVRQEFERDRGSRHGIVQSFEDLCSSRDDEYLCILLKKAPKKGDGFFV